MQPKKSSFVTTLSILLIIFSGFGLLIAIIQNLMIYLISGFSEPENPLINDPFETIRLNVELIIGLFSLATLFTFISSIGLFRRKNWARITLLGLLVFWILWILITPTLQWFYFFDGEGLPLSAEPENILSLVLTLVLAAIVLALVLVCIWIFRKLSSEKIKAEFK